MKIDIFGDVIKKYEKVMSRCAKFFLLKEYMN